jgi:hypothetical protein
MEVAFPSADGGLIFRGKSDLIAPYAKASVPFSASIVFLCRCSVL